MRRSNILAFIFLGPFSAGVAFADTGPLGFGAPEVNSPLVADRPDFTEATSVIEPGHLQLEAGYTFARNDDAEVQTESHTAPEALVRVGLLSALEARLSWQGYSRERSVGQEGSNIEGVSDLALGVKQLIVEERAGLPSLGYILQLGIPAGEDEVSAHHIEPVLKMLWAMEVSNGLSIAGNLNAESLYAEERFFEMSASFSFGYEIADSVGGFTEYFALFPEEDNGEDEHYLNTGFTYSATRHLQFDVRIGAGLNDAAADLFTGAGIAWRI